MSRGIGKTQQRILDELAATTNRWYLTVVELAERLGVSDRQVRRAVHSLHGHGLVVLTKEHADWKGSGEYGRLVPRHWPSLTKDVPTAFTVKAGEPWPGKEGYVARRDTEFILNGMPTGASLCVWLPEQRAKRLDGARQYFGEKMVGILREKDVPKPDEHQRQG